MEKLCRYQEIQGNTGIIARRLRCCNCGDITEPTDIPVENFQASHARVCSSTNDRIAVKLPSPLSRFLSYAYYLGTDRRPAPDDVIFERFSICSACDLYNDTYGMCGVCGCYANLLRINEGPNKLSDLNQACPLPDPNKKWNKIEPGR